MEKEEGKWWIQAKHLQCLQQDVQMNDGWLDGWLETEQGQEKEKSW